MLYQLQIKNFTLIEQLDLVFNSGFSVMTGETGAGKSILVEALGLALGNRAVSTVIRNGADKAEITASFDLTNLDSVTKWLHTHDLESDNECHLRRILSRDGRTRSYINTRPVPLQYLRELGELLVDIHSQHEHHALLKRDFQLRLLDKYARHDQLLTEVSICYSQWKKLESRLREYEKNNSSNSGQLELLCYQIDELNQLDLGENEVEELEQEHSRLNNASELIYTCQSSIATLGNEENSVISRLNKVIKDLGHLKKTDQQLTTVTEILDSASVQLDEAISELNHYVDNFHHDPDQLTIIEQRLEKIYDIARKHSVNPTSLYAHKISLQDRLHDSENSTIEIEKLKQAIGDVVSQYHNLASKLRTSRKKAAASLEKKISDKMIQLGLSGGYFSIHFDTSNEDQLNDSGSERIDFMVSTNPGQEAGKLTKIASGGELSRISLAIQVITAHQYDVPVLILDEVDVGIGGKIAEIVGKELRSLGLAKQVLCVTHLPQVAAQGNHHIQVSKQTRDKSTLTRIDHLSREERHEEIARMLGGIQISDKTRAHAEELIEGAEN